jgi:hypothetical protein
MLEYIDVTQHGLPNDELELCHDTSDSGSMPKNGQVQLRAHARAAFAAESPAVWAGRHGSPWQ